MTVLMYVILGSATGIKILLFIYCYALKTQSGGILRSLACPGSTSIPSCPLYQSLTECDLSVIALFPSCSIAGVTRVLLVSAALLQLWLWSWQRG